MLYRPTDIHKKDSLKLEASQSNQHRNKHGHFSILLALPSESLTHITSSLNPPSLLALGQTNRYLNKHVTDDNTWHRAFVCQFLGIDPEGDMRHAKTLLLRRSESSWRKEFIVRYNLTRRWKRSHNPTITHTPHHSTVSGMLLMPEDGLLTSSIEYGIVSRSLPLTGKILRGYLDASGTGLGIGNPNAEFTPNVTACALSSDGGTAKIVWGFRSGEVALLSANKAMDHGRAAAKLTRCKVIDEHTKAVQDVVWCTNSTFVTGALDGKVKLWDAKRVKCVWTSEIKEGSLVADPCVKVTAIITKGVIVGAMKSGDIVVWTGLDALLSEDADQRVKPIVLEIRIPTHIPEPVAQETSTTRDIIAIHLEYPAPFKLLILTAYAGSPQFHRFCIDLLSNSVDSVPFGDGSFGSITAITSSLSSQEGESSFVIVGDQLGCIGIYDWNASLSSGLSNVKPPSIHTLRNFEAHEDGAVTAIAWNPITFVTGSSRGTIKIWDSLTFAPLRCFSSPGARPPAGGEWDGVGHIILRRDLLIVSVGRRVMAWMAGPVMNRGQSTWKRKHIKNLKKNGAAKGYQQLELYRDITESRQEIDDQQAYVKRAYGREREQRSTLNNLGLDELEALEYVLMLSRDEAQARNMEFPAVSEEGVFEGDFEGVSVYPTADFPSSSSTRSSLSSLSHTSRPIPRTSPSMSNRKVQVSPRFRPEPTEAGFGISPLNLNAIASTVSASSNTVVTHTVLSPSLSDNFPPISPSTSNPGTPGTSFIRHSVSSSPEASRSAWSTPRRSGPPSEVPSPGLSSSFTSRATVWRTTPSTSSTSSESLAADLARHANVNVSERSGENMDADLKFAIELSLVEARSRGHEV